MKFPDWLPVFGDLKYRNKKCPTEDAELITFINEVRPIEPTVLHIKNEGKRHYTQAQKDKAKGLNPGASDIMIPGCPAFVCEMKRQDHTICHWQDGQIEYLEKSKLNGAFVCVALGYKAALEAYKKWKSICNTAGK